MKEAVLQSKNYEMFELCEFNRDVKKTAKLELSMLKHGWLGPYPMHVMQISQNRYAIKGGHHRFQVARYLGIPVKYVVSNDTLDIHEAEGATVPWTLQHYQDSFVRCKKPAYIAVGEYHDRTGIPLGLCVSMLAGDSANSAGNQGPKFKAGKYKLGDQTHANLVGDLVLYCKLLGVEWAAVSNFVRALSKIVWVKKISIPTLRHKLKSNFAYIKKQHSVSAYIDMLEAVYNSRNKNKLPLTFLADEAARARSVNLPG